MALKIQWFDMPPPAILTVVWRQMEAKCFVSLNDKIINEKLKYETEREIIYL